LNDETGAVEVKKPDGTTETITLKPADGLSGPDIRRVKAGAKTSGEGWMGLISHDAYTVQASRRTPLAPGWLYFLLAAIAMGWAWRREGL